MSQSMSVSPKIPLFLGVFTLIIFLFVTFGTYHKYRNWESVHDASYVEKNCKTEYRDDRHNPNNHKKHKTRKVTTCDAVITYTYHNQKHTEIHERYKGFKSSWRLVDPEFYAESEEIWTNLIVIAILGLFGVACISAGVYSMRKMR